MKQLSVVLVFLLIASTFLGISQASANQTLTADTGEKSIAMGIKVKASYEALLTINKPSSALPSESKNWDIQLSGGTLSLSVYIPSPINEWYSISKLVPIGSYYDIPVAEAISARIKILASTPVNVDGQASVDASFLSWEGEDTKSITVSVNADAKSGDKITVNMPFTFDIDVGLVIGFLFFKYEVASINIGRFNASPVISEVMTVETPIDLRLILMVSTVAGALAITAIGGYSFHKKRKSNQYPYPPPPPPI